MPYASNANLPPAVKKLDVRLQTAFRKAFNAAFDTYRGDEQKAFATAWATVNKMRENQSLHPSFLRVRNLFLSRYGKEEGADKYSYFLVRNGLDPSKNYDPHVQFNESFSWAEPYIRFMKQDKQAKFYAVRALHAIISLNNNNYTDLADMENAAMSMNYRPLNYNHDHSRWIPYPRTRVEYAKAEDMCVELILRVDNQDVYLQKQLDHDPSIPEKEWINHPSIEGRPMLGGAGKGYHFTALAMLEKGYHIPGDPLSEIFPIMMEGIQGGEVCLMVNGEKVCLECDSALTEGKPMSEDYKIGEINHGGAVCPNCDHIVNLDGIKIPSEVDCPNCGTAMEARPEKTVETANKLNNPAPITTDMSIPAEEVVIDKTPSPIVSAEQALRDAENMSNSELKVEIARVNAEIAYKNADLIEVTTKLREVERDRRNETNEARTEEIKLRNQLASKTREVAHLGFLKTTLSGVNEELAVTTNLLTEEKDKNFELQKISDSKDIRHEALNKEFTALKEDYNKRGIQFDDVRKDRNNLSVMARAAEEKALNETRERSRIELDNADLLDKQRELTADISKLTERISVGATQKLAQEKALAALLTENLEMKKNHEAKLAETIQTIEKAKKFHTWAWQQLKEAGVAVLQKEE